MGNRGASPASRTLQSFPEVPVPPSEGEMLPFIHNKLEMYSNAQIGCTSQCTLRASGIKTCQIGCADHSAVATPDKVSKPEKERNGQIDLS